MVKNLHPCSAGMGIAAILLPLAFQPAFGADYVSIFPDISCRVADVNQVYQLSGTNANATTVTIGHVYCKVAGKPEKEVPRHGTRETSGNASVITTIIGTKDFGEMKVTMGNSGITSLEMLPDDRDKLAKFLGE
jgi:hypothetical protein